MDWHVQYRDAMGDRLVMFSTPERAIEAACGLIDQGHDVYGIGTGPLTDTIKKEHIERIYAMWARTQYLFDRIPCVGVKRRASR